MALSQLQCLDNNNVNWRSSETKPEFFYSEEQRLALEALVSSGQDAFYQVVKKENIRDFLSELEVTDIEGRVEPFDPDSSYPRKSVSEGEGDLEDDVEHSLEYWPDRSDCSIPELDLGWPDTVAYRGVTRAAVYMQPPIDGQPHIKEVVRKMITQAQRVIAVVMDLFTDVDIFKDLMDAGFKRKISVYIILNESDVKHFLQMCEKAQMHRGHLKNLRIRSVGGAEFYTRVSTKFKGCLGQKFMFVDGDKTVCGSYSFTWSAARIDRNLITVLSGQVVETFDRQFQELYLLSKGVSLKNVPMANEPEPEPVIQPAALPAEQLEAIAKKMINPKYALVSVKSASEAGKDSKKEAELAKKIPTRPRVVPVEQQMHEQQIHPALQDMERADMFEYLPTWVEPDPEPGSDILGYINIIDPKIMNALPSQMNRIKICDTSQATAHYMQQTRENELLRQRSESPSAKNIYREPSHEHDSKHGPNQSTSVMEADQSPSRGHPLRQTSQEHGSKASSTKNSISRQGSLEEPMAREDGTIRQHDGEVIASYETQEILSPQNFSESIASLAANHHLVSRNSSSGSAGGKPPPVPKPRTLQVTDFITMKNAINTRSLRSSTSTEENTVPSVNGVDAEGREAEEIDILIESEPNDQDEDDAEMFRSCTAEYSSSGSGSLPPSNASSMSEEYYPSGSLHRRSSERISNGERPPLHRKLSDSHISRGSFLSPLNISHNLEVNPSENGKKRTMLEEYVISSNPLQRKERLYGLDNSQGKQHYQYTTNGPTGGFDRFHSHPGTRNIGRGKKDAMDGPGAYRQLSRKSDNNPGARPGYWNSKDYGSSYTSPLSQSPAPPETATSPFGIPYSKLSQAKHLKSKIGAGSLDSRRRGHGPPGHKDL